MALIELATKAARRLFRKLDHDHPDPNNLENYFSANQEIELHCTTEEREDLECMDSTFKVDADVIDDPAMFAKLVKHLRDYGLRLI